MVLVYTTCINITESLLFLPIFHIYVYFILSIEEIAFIFLSNIINFVCPVEVYCVFCKVGTVLINYLDKLQVLEG
jgi:hypothetical protein